MAWKNTHCFLSAVGSCGIKCFYILKIYIWFTLRRHFYTHHTAATNEGKHILSFQSFVKQTLKVCWKFHWGWSYNCLFKLHTQTGCCFVIPCRCVLLWALTLTGSLSGGLKAAPQGQGMGHSLRCNCHCGLTSLRWLGVIRGGRKLRLLRVQLEFRVEVPLNRVQHTSLSKCVTNKCHDSHIIIKNTWCGFHWYLETDTVMSFKFSVYWPKQRSG